MRILYESLVLPVTKQLADELTRLIASNPLKERSEATINFRDPKYSAEAGGYHPVEIRLERKGQEWTICYITDFGYFGCGQDAELTKALDFDFQAGMFQDISGYYPIETALQIYPIWEENFLTYWLDMKVFEVEVS